LEVRDMTMILIGAVLGVAAELGLWAFCDWFIRAKDLEDAEDS